jgi:hypothetical protein
MIHTFTTLTLTHIQFLMRFLLEQLFHWWCSWLQNNPVNALHTLKVWSFFHHLFLWCYNTPFWLSLIVHVDCPTWMQTWHPIHFALFHGYHLNYHFSKYIMFQIINTTILNHIIVHLHQIDVLILCISICFHKEKMINFPTKSNKQRSSDIFFK